MRLSDRHQINAEGSLTRTADHLQALDLNVASFLFRALFAFPGFVLLVAFCLESASNRYLVANMIAEFYSRAAKAVDLSVISGKTKFIGFVSFLQTAGYGLAAGLLFAFLSACRYRSGRKSEADSENKNESLFHGEEHWGKSPFNHQKIPLQDEAALNGE